MAKTQTDAAYEADAEYDVRFAKVVDVAGMKLRPAHAYTLLGSVLETLPADAIQSAAVVRRD